MLDEGTLTFEQAFSQLEEAVARLENGGLAIDDMVDQFERGMLLVRLCRERLDQAQARVTVLTRATDEDADFAAIIADE